MLQPERDLRFPKVQTYHKKAPRRRCTIKSRVGISVCLPLPVSKLPSTFNMATKILANWAAGLQPETLPLSVQRAARRSLYNYLGCAIGGSDHPTVKKAHDALAPLFGASTSTIFGTQSKTDCQHAALLNGISSHVHDYDDTHLATIIHPTGVVASALLAVTEYLPNQTITRPRLLCALVVGIETACKLGLAVWPTHYDVGWHITSTTGSVGAAVAVGKLLELHPERMAHAIGIAAAQVTGMRDMFGTDTKSFHIGRAAQNGVIAALLAEKGYTASETALEAKRGWANVVVGGGEPQLDHYLDELGKVWEIERNAFKPFPCGIVCHPAIDACIQLRQELQHREIRIDDIIKVDARVHPLVIELTSKRYPKDGLEGKFSAFHGCAVGLLFGKATPAQYTDQIVTDKAVVSLRDRVDAHPDVGLSADEAYLTVRFKDGTKLEKHVEHAIGSLAVPMTNEQLTEKFLDQGKAVIGDRIHESSAAAWELGECDDVAAVIGRL